MDDKIDLNQFLVPMDINKEESSYLKVVICDEDGKYEKFEGDNFSIPKVTWLEKSGEQWTLGDGPWGKRRNASKSELQNLLKLDLPRAEDGVLSMFYNVLDDEGWSDESRDHVSERIKNGYIEYTCDQILDLLDKNQEVLTKDEHLSYLGYFMLRWSNLYSIGRYFGVCDNNPKYEIEDIPNTEEIENRIYDAWAVTIDILSTLPKEFKDKLPGKRVGTLLFTEEQLDELAAMDYTDDFTRLLNKKNKTMDDWYELLGDERYEYHSMYKTQKAIDDHLLCTNGNGYDWNDQGYLCNDGPSGMDNDDYVQYFAMKGKAPEGVKEIDRELSALLNRPEIQQAMKDGYAKWIREVREYAARDILRYAGRFMFEDVMMSDETRDIMEKRKVENEKKLEERMKELEGDELETLQKALKSIAKREDQKSKINVELRGTIKRAWDGMPQALKHQYRQAEIAIREELDLLNQQDQAEEMAAKEADPSLKTRLDMLEEGQEQIKEKLMEASVDAAVEIDAENPGWLKMLDKLWMDSLGDFPDARPGKPDCMYYDLSNYSAMMSIPSNVHPSYMDACKRIAENILSGDPMDVPDDDRLGSRTRLLNNQSAVRKWLAAYYPEHELAKEDEEINLVYIVAEISRILEGLPVKVKPGAYSYRRHQFDKSMQVSVKVTLEDNPEIMGRSVEAFKGHNLYETFRELESVMIGPDNVKDYKFVYDHTDSNVLHVYAAYGSRGEINYEHQKFKDKVNQEFVEKGFMLGRHQIFLPLEGGVMRTEFPETLGLTHPDNKSKRDFFSKSKELVVEINGKANTYRIDERGFNTLQSKNVQDKNVDEWVTGAFKDFKASDPAYGTYDGGDRSREGKRKLYAHDFMLHLRQNQPKLV